MPEPPEPPPPPPSLPAKELPINRYKFIWRVLMISNLVLGAYMFIGVKKRDPGTLKRKSETGVKNHKPVVEVPSVPTTTPTTTSTTSETWDM